MFFDNAKYFEFVAKWESQCPLSLNQAIGSTKTFTNITANFRIDLPEDLIDAVDACKTNADKTRVMRPFSNHGVKSSWSPCIHFIRWENQKILDKYESAF
jgi:hypothetical protein